MCISRGAQEGLADAPATPQQGTDATSALGTLGEGRPLRAVPSSPVLLGGRGGRWALQFSVRYWGSYRWPRGL